MLKRQAGVTFIGWIVLLIPVAIVLYMAIRVVPIYLNHMKVASAMSQAADESRGETNVSPQAVRRSIERRLDIEGVAYPTMQDITVARDGDNWVIEVAYDQVAPLFGDINLLVAFDKRVVVQ